MITLQPANRLEVSLVGLSDRSVMLTSPTDSFAMSLTPFMRGENGNNAYQIALTNGFVGTETEWLASLQGPPGTAPITWSFYKDHWSSVPTTAGTTAGGSVLAYVLDGVTRYRLVPAPYDPAQDAFYTTFEAGVLSGLIAKRG